MSGPTVIDYRAIERERAEAARRRWRALRGRAEAFERRCVTAGHPECVVTIRKPAGSSSVDVERQCNQLESALARATAELSGRQLDDRTREVVAGMNRVLSDLESREQATAAAAEDGAPTAHPQVDYVERVSRQLALLEVPAPELERATEAVLSATDPDRARLLYTDLVQRISDANRVADALIERRYEIAELRAQLEGLHDPDPVEALLDHAATAVERGDDVLIPLQQARAAITHQLDAAAAEADREFVRQAVAESLTEMGYEVADVTVETPDSLVFRQNGTHGLRAHIRDGEIDLRTVRLGSGKDAGADRGADDEFCRRMPGLLAAMSRRGVAAGVKDQKLPGLFAPETVPLRRKAGPTPTAADHQHQPATRKRTGQ